MPRSISAMITQTVVKAHPLAGKTQKMVKIG